MSGYISIVIFIYYIVILSYILLLFGKYKVCPELLWCCFQLLMFFGVTHFIDSSVKSDRLLILLYLLGLTLFIASNTISRMVLCPNRRIIVERRPDLFRIRKPYIWPLMILCIVLCASFFARGGGNVFLNGLRSIINGSDYSVKYSRMNLLSLSGVGYIYQLRVIVLPLLVLYYILVKGIKPITTVLLIVMVLFLIGTGQRGGLASFIMIVLITVYYLSQKGQELNQEKKHSKLMIYAGVIIASGVLFSLSTVMNGRVAEGGTVFSAIVKRFVEDNQSCAVFGFRYIVTQPIQNGQDWLMQLADLLPGKNNYSSLDSRIFAYMNRGSLAGTAPPCIWGSAYYNFGIIGPVILGSILGWLNALIHNKFSKRVLDESGVVIYSALQFLLAYWVAGGPIVLFNSGFFSVLILQFVFYFSLKYRIVFGRSNKY